MTFDADFLYTSDADIPISIEGFRKARTPAFIHRGTGIEFEMLSSEYLKVDKATVKKVFDTCVKSEGFKIASPEGLVAMKLCRWNRQDQADCAAVMLATKGNMKPWNLDRDATSKLQVLLDENSLIKWTL